MPTLLERALEWNKEVNQEWLERGREQGIEQGRQEGIERERQGIKREIGLLQRLVSSKFGVAVADQIAPALEALEDPEGIETVADAVLECATAEEFLARANELRQRSPGD